jgi:hypothetical protein
MYSSIFNNTFFPKNSRIRLDDNLSIACLLDSIKILLNFSSFIVHLPMFIVFISNLLG